MKLLFLQTKLSYSKKNSNNLVIILGDRYELLPIAQILYLFKKIVIHLHGGEITQGSWDDSIRHSISKLSRIHFVTSNSAKEILLRLGEQRKNIYNQPPPKIKPYFMSIDEEEEYELEEGDYQIDLIPKVSGYSILITTMYLLQYVICKLPGKWFSN